MMMLLQPFLNERSGEGGGGTPAPLPSCILQKCVFENWIEADKPFYIVCEINLEILRMFVATVATTE